MLLRTLFLLAAIIETVTVQDIIPLIEEDGWLVVDIDNTIFFESNGAVQVVEPAFIPALVDAQQRGIVVMGLTHRAPLLADTTIYQLSSLGWDFSPTAPLSGASAVMYRGGILFVGPQNRKGEVFVQFLASMGQRPRKVIFIDDLKINVEDVERALLEEGIDCLCVHYQARRSSLRRGKDRSNPSNRTELRGVDATRVHESSPIN